MITYHGRQCKLRRHIYTWIDGLFDQIRHKKNGYAFWAGLSVKGRAKWRTELNNSLLNTFYSDDFLAMLITAALDKDGRIRHAELFHWLLSHIYLDETHTLYTDWLSLKHTYPDKD